MVMKPAFRQVIKSLSVPLERERGVVANFNVRMNAVIVHFAQTLFLKITMYHDAECEFIT